MRKYENTYWNGKGKHQELYDRLRVELVPDEGEAKTVRGEILRLTGNIYYDIMNNGGCNLGQNGFRAKLVKLIPPEKKIQANKFSLHPPRDWLTNNAYLKSLDVFVDWVVLYVNSLESFKETTLSAHF